VVSALLLLLLHSKLQRPLWLQLQLPVNLTASRRQKQLPLLLLLLAMVLAGSDQNTCYPVLS
jgi:hypothetical protein